MHWSRWIYTLLLLYCSFFCCKENSCFRVSPSCTPDCLTWTELYQPDRPGQCTVVAYIISLYVWLSLESVHLQHICNIGSVWTTCGLSVFSFFQMQTQWGESAGSSWGECLFQHWMRGFLIWLKLLTSNWNVTRPWSDISKIYDRPMVVTTMIPWFWLNVWGRSERSMVSDTKSFGIE